MKLKLRYLVGITASAALLVGGFAAASATPSPQGSAPEAAACTSIKTTLGSSSGAAGSTYQKFRFTNTGSSSCTLAGYPGVSYVNLHKIMVGWPALAQRSPRGRSAAPSVVLPPGQTATAVQQIPDYGNYARVDCIPFNAFKVRVTIAGTTTYLPWNHTECTTRYGRSFIGPVYW